MTLFNVLDRNLSIHRSYFLEASAGTGKTFSIENLVVRLLLESMEESESTPLPLDAILVVTFTRAATRELKARIRVSIERALYFLEMVRSTNDIPQDAPDYLRKIMETGGDELAKSCRNLEKALSRYEEAQIFTIHGFCARMLSEFAFEGGASFNTECSEEDVAISSMEGLVRDFFRTMPPDGYSTSQLQAALSSCKGNELALKIVGMIKKGRKILAPPPFRECFERFIKAHASISAQFSPSSEKIMEDFYVLAPCYYGLCTKKNTVHEDKRLRAQSFAALFDKKNLEVQDFESLFGNNLLALLSPGNLKKAAKMPSKLHYPGFFDAATSQLQPILLDTFDPRRQVARMARDCMRLKESKQSTDEIWSPDEILKRMHSYLALPEFIEKIRHRYTAAIIDEFQDTDPLQWEIFANCFLPKAEKQKFCYLIGDPKQSIYAFRQADIYTYLQAADRIGEQNRACLTTNYRSQPLLVAALNELFSSTKGSQWMPLPKLNTYLEVLPVSSAPHRQPNMVNDQRKSIHFLLSPTEKLSMTEIQEEVLIPFIADEIARLKQHEGILYSSAAVLVKDRYQAQRVVHYLKSKGIPALTKRTASLLDSDAVDAIEDLIKAMVDPGNSSQLRKALGGKIFGWTHERISTLSEQMDREEKVFAYFIHLQKIWKQGSFALFYEEVMHRNSLAADLGQKSPAETILQSKEGEKLYSECMQLAEILIEEDAKHLHTPETLLRYIQALKQTDPDEEASLKVIQEEGQNAVQIMTQHTSKGLEFDFVFALGLASRQTKEDDLVPQAGNDEFLVVPEEGSVDQERHYEELDAEKMRQLYVVMTRAKERLYVPIIFLKQKLQLGKASPIELFLAHQGGNVESYSMLYERVKALDLTAVEGILDKWKAHADISDEKLERKKIGIDNPPASAEAFDGHHLQEPLQFDIPGKIRRIHSFSSLHLLSNHRVLKEEEVRKVLPEGITAHSLPLGPATGTLIHSILQEIPLKKLLGAQSPQDLSSFISSFLKGSLLEAWTEAVAQMIFNTFQIPIKGSFSTFSLRQIDPSKVMREMEFLFASKEPLTCEEIKVEEGMLGGFIDYLFEFQGRYYFVDWKTNWLGPNKDEYASEKLAQAMKKHGYFLQEGIYTQALRQYFGLFEKRPFEEYFGGAFYLFMRGIDPQNPPGTGVFYVPPCPSGGRP